MISDFHTFWQFFSAWKQYYLRRWTKPATISIIFGSLFDTQRSKTDLIAENALLRQQLIVLNRQVKHPQLTNRDRVRLVLLSRFTKYWKQAIHIVQSGTIMRWHREFFRFYWKQKSKPIKKKSRISPETIALIQQIANENRLWGAERIRVGSSVKLFVESNR